MGIIRTRKLKIFVTMIIILAILLIILGIRSIPKTYASTSEDGLFDYIVKEDNTVAITYCNDIGVDDITIPYIIDGYYVTTICSGAFSMTGAETVYIQENIINIENEAFGLGNLLVSINVSESNLNYCSEDGILFNKNKTKIIRYPQLKEGQTYKIPDSVYSIEDGAFLHCHNLKNITIPENVTYIGNRAFNSSGIQSVDIPEGITEIATSAFGSCLSLTSITLPDSVTCIQDNAFEWCQNLKDVKLNDNITEIRSNAFFSCDMESIEIPSSVETIGFDAFSCNYNLKYAVMPNSLKDIGRTIFRGSDSSFKIYLIKDSSVESYAREENYPYEYLRLNEINIKEFPTKTIYNIGENFSDEGMIINAIYSYEDDKTVEYKVMPDDYVILPNESLTFGTDKVIVSYENNGITKTVSQSIVVVDNIKPIINSVTGNETEWTNKDITLVINATDGESGIAGYSFDNGETWQTTNTKNYMKNTSGIIIEVKDNTGNITTYEQTINIDKIDKTPPTITITPNGASISPNKSVTISVADIGGSGLSNNNSYQYQLGTSRTLVPTGTWQDYTSGTEFSIGEGLTGDYYLWIKTIEDNAGNQSAEAEYVVSNQFTFQNIKDKTAPTISSVTGNATEWTNENVTLTINATDSESGIATTNGYSFDNGKTWQTSNTKIYTENTSGIIIQVKDNAGNITSYEQTINIDKIDTAKATISSVTGNATEWTNENVTLTINATDNESGIATTNGYSFDNGKTWQTSNIKTYTENTSGIIIQVKDSAGNITSYEQTINIDKIDKTAPTIIISPNGTSAIQNKYVTITATDVGGSGLSSNNSYQYQLGTSSTVVPTGTWQDYTSGTEFTIGEGLTGDYYLWIKTIIDNAGNESSKTDYIVSNKFTFDNSEDVDVDTIAPELRIEYSTTQLTNKSVTATIVANEQLQQLEGWTISEDNKTLTKIYTENIDESIDVYDLAGNKASIQVKIANIDTTKPELSVEYDITQPTNKAVTATITANEQVQQLEGWTISEDNKTLTKIYTENTEESIDVYDLAGNKASIQVKIANIDKTEIQVTVEYSTTILTNKNVTVRIISNKEIQEVDGWILSEDKKTLTKEYTKNDDENIKIQDLVGNEREIKISVQNIDKLSPKINVEYSTLKQTNKSITVSITSDEKLQAIEGWTLEKDGKKLTKIYTKNTTENIDVYDLSGNKVTAKITINNIDTKVPKIDVRYSMDSNTNDSVVVTIISDEQLQQLDGWTISDDGKTLTKKYEENGQEIVKIYDLAGNEIEVEISINNINKTTIQEPGNNNSENIDKVDTDTAPTIIPYAGNNALLGVLIIIIIISIVLWMKNKKFKDIK